MALSGASGSAFLLPATEVREPCGQLQVHNVPHRSVRTLNECAPVSQSMGCTRLASAAVVLVALAGSASTRRWRRGDQRVRRHRQRLASSRANVRCSAADGDTELLLHLEDVEAQSTDEAAKHILKGVSLDIREGEVHAIMGLNGSGKSTLAKVLIGDPAYEVTGGTAELDQKNLLDMEPHERALAGLFLAFQSPPAINGVSNLDFLRAIYNAQRREKGEPELDVIEFYGLASEKLNQLKISMDYLNRNVNEGFSGGERKRNEMLQLSVLAPRLAILDEVDSGLDIDALKDVADAIQKLRSQDSKRSMLIVTHFERFLKYVDADFVHVMHQGRIVKSGGKDLSTKLDEQGYDWIIKDLETA